MEQTAEYMAAHSSLVALLKRTTDRAEAAEQAGNREEANRILRDSDAISRTLLLLAGDSK